MPGPRLRPGFVMSGGPMTEPEQPAEETVADEVDVEDEAAESTEDDTEDEDAAPEQPL